MKKATPQTDTLLIDARLLLSCRRVISQAYQTVGVREHEIKKEPYFNWVPEVLKLDLLDAAAVQLVRDTRFVEGLFKNNELVRERAGALDLAHLFSEAGGRVHVFSHETETALAGIVARAGLSPNTTLHPLIDPARVDAFVMSGVKSGLFSDWTLVYTVGLTIPVQRRVVQAISGRGTHVNVDTENAGSQAEERLFDLVNERWSYTTE